MTEKLCIILIVICVIIAVMAIASYRIHTIRIIRALDKMLDQAIDGSFVEENYDESMISVVETKLARYLSSSELSVRNVTREKEKIKELISDISHQTKTPLSNIILYTELLNEQEINEQASSCAKNINGQAKKLSFLIEALVKLSRLETGVFKLTPVCADMTPMLENVYEQYREKAEEKGLKFTLECKKTEAFYDEKWCAEALGNIVDNAIKYTKKGYVKISVKEYEMFSAVMISDSGTGILEEEQGMIFTRFYRSPSVSQMDGLGIGLYLAREIVAGCGGYMKVNSEIGKGTTFSVYFPR